MPNPVHVALAPLRLQQRALKAVAQKVAGAALDLAFGAEEPLDYEPLWLRPSSPMPAGI